VGYAEKIYERIEEALSLCRHMIEECDCVAGCPSCVPPLPPGVNDEDLEEFLVESNGAVACTKSLLAALLDGRVEVPKVELLRRRREAAVEPPGEYEEALRLGKRLTRASKVLSGKREREH
jgi:ATP-dependent helicase YprA (DUF1998 family)